jgi:hypothetical protein
LGAETPEPDLKQEIPMSEHPMSEKKRDPPLGASASSSASRATYIEMVTPQRPGERPRPPGPKGLVYAGLNHRPDPGGHWRGHRRDHCAFGYCLTLAKTCSAEDLET